MLSVSIQVWGIYRLFQSRSYHNLLLDRRIGSTLSFCGKISRGRWRDNSKYHELQTFGFVLAAVSLLAGCSVHRLDYREVSTRLIEPNQGALVTPLIADMELVSEEKIQPYTEEFGQLTCQSLSCVEVYKKTALLNAAKKYGADVIVAATIEVETTDSGNLKITVMGFPARYTNFRKATEKDAWMVGMHRVINQGNVSPVLLKENE